MTSILKLREIKSIVENLDVVAAMKDGFIQYSNGKTVVPPVGELLFEDPPGDVHIKYGYIKHDDYYVIKIASGFYENSKLGIASSQGLMLLFNQKTGQLVSVLLDEGYLTDIRTAAAGALAARYFAPSRIEAFGMIGTGIQARFQLQMLAQDSACRKVWIWGRNRANAEKMRAELEADFDINVADSPAEVARYANLIVTTTPAENGLLKATDIRPGTHITAVGSDTSAKQELESALLGKADLVISDSLPQSRTRGEIFRAVSDGAISRDQVVEFGIALQNPSLQRQNDRQISIVDLTGVAVQDIMIAQSVFRQSQNV